MNRYESILKDVGLKRTDIRLRMLNIFMNSEIALSHHDVCEQLGDGYDKVTVYRNIYTFVNKGVLHETPNDGRSAKFACNLHDVSKTGAHAHFICEICGNTFCLQSRNSSELSLPGNFKVNHLSIVAQGVCSECDKNEKY